MKILLVYFGYLPNIGGIEMQMHSLAKCLIKRGHDVTVLTSNAVNFKPANLKKEEYIDGVRVKRVSCYRVLPYKFLFFTPAVVPAVLREEADIVHVFSYLPTFMTNVACIVSKFKKARLIMTPTFHPQRPIYYSGFLQKALMPFYDKVLGFGILKMADAVTGLTEAETQYYRQRGIKKVYLMSDGLVLNQDRSEAITDSDLAEFRQKFGLGDDKILISVGRIEGRKGLDLLVKAFVKVHQAVPNSKLLIVGKDWGHRSTLEELAQEIGIRDDVIFTGLLSDRELYCAYEIAGTIVHPSLFETICRIALEAWLHKKPIIVFDKVGEPVTPETGILVTYRDTEGLSEAIIKLLSEPELGKRLGQNGFELLREKYDWDRIVDGVEQVYRDNITKCSA